MVLQIEVPKAFIGKENQTSYFSLVLLNESLKALRRDKANWISAIWPFNQSLI